MKFQHPPGHFNFSRVLFLMTCEVAFKFKSCPALLTAKVPLACVCHYVLLNIITIFNDFFTDGALIDDYTIFKPSLDRLVELLPAFFWLFNNFLLCFTFNFNFLLFNFNSWKVLAVCLLAVDMDQLIFNFLSHHQVLIEFIKFDEAILTE